METNDVIELVEEPPRRTHKAARRLIVATAGISVFFAGSVAVVANTDDADEVEVATPPHLQSPSTTSAAMQPRFPDIVLEGWELLGSEEGDLDNLSRSEIIHNAAFRDPSRGWAGPVVEVFVEPAYGDDYGAYSEYEGEDAVDIGGAPGYVYEGFAGGMSIDFDKGEHHLYVDTYHLDRATSIAAAAAIAVDTDGNVTAGALPEGLAQYEIARSAPAHVFGRESEYTKDGNNVVFTMRAETAAEFERFSASCSFGSEGFDGTTALGQNALRVWNTYDGMAAVLWYADGIGYELFAHAGGLDAVNDAVASLRRIADDEATSETDTTTTTAVRDAVDTTSTSVDATTQDPPANILYPNLLVDGWQLRFTVDGANSVGPGQLSDFARPDGEWLEFRTSYPGVPYVSPEGATEIIEVLGETAYLVASDEGADVYWHNGDVEYTLSAPRLDTLEEAIPMLYIASDEEWAAAQPE